MKPQIWTWIGYFGSDYFTIISRLSNYRGDLQDKELVWQVTIFRIDHFINSWVGHFPEVNFDVTIWSEISYGKCVCYNVDFSVREPFKSSKKIILAAILLKECEKVISKNCLFLVWIRAFCKTSGPSKYQSYS